MRRSFAPGRVNLIGEHVDYHGLPVLPMALEQGIRVDFTPRDDDRVVLRNAHPEFEARSFSIREDLNAGPAGDWGNYVMAAARTVFREYGVGIGIQGTVGSTLPAAAGLSSSAALVVAVANALLSAGECHVPEVDLAQALAEGERFVGTAGGGMDQAASLAGERGHALHIRFDPLRIDPVALPADWRVIIAHSGVSAEKSGAARDAYNVRRHATEKALAAAAEALGMPGASVPALLERQEAAAVVDALGGTGTRGGAWAVHAVTENTRVREALAALRTGNLEAFGTALNGSHASLRDVYGVSHPALDRLVDAAVEAGAAGARLTGAGFGGCMLAVCTESRAVAVKEALVAAQDGLSPRPALKPFPARPGSGARVVEVTRG